MQRLRRSCLIAVASIGLVVLATTSPAAAATDFTLTGTVSGLYPGFQGTMPVTVTNPTGGGDPGDHRERRSNRHRCGTGMRSDTGHAHDQDTSIMLEPAATVDVPSPLQLATTAPGTYEGAMFADRVARTRRGR